MTTNDTHNAVSILSIPVITALLSVYLFWGATYLAMKFAIETLPPYIMLTSRFGFAGLFMYIILRLKNVEAPTKKQWMSAAITGGILLFLATGSVTLAQTTIPSNIAATIIAAVPLWIALFQWTIFKQGSPGIWTSLGLVLGFIGVAMLVSSSGSKEGSGAAWGYFMLVFASAMWAFGSLLSRVLETPKSPFMAISAQMLMGALFCLIAGMLKGEFSVVIIADLSTRSIIAMLYLIIFGSVVAYSAYIWLLKNTSPAIASTYAYVNPVVAILMGWIFAGETLIMQEIFAVFIILVAVMAIIKENSKVKKLDIQKT
jgi:drug/metabolite transporter (DMT)-like permease